MNRDTELDEVFTAFGMKRKHGKLSAWGAMRDNEDIRRMIQSGELPPAPEAARWVLANTPEYTPTGRYRGMGEIE